MSKSKSPQYFAAAIEIRCPCGEFLGNPTDGSHLWMGQDFVTANGQVHCYACGKDIPIRHEPPTRVLVEPN